MRSSSEGASSCSSTSCTTSSAPASREGAMDAGNMLKPMLARGELHCIGATTLDEYRKHIEKDAALERRFQPFRSISPRRGHRLDPPRAPRALRGAPRRAHPGQRARLRRRRSPPLHHRPLPPRQGDRPGRRGVRHGPHRDRLAARRARRGAPPRHAARDRGGRAQEGEGRGQQAAPRKALRKELADLSARRPTRCAPAGRREGPSASVQELRAQSRRLRHEIERPSASTT